LTLVLDANVAVAACAEAGGFAELGDSELVAPALLWSEFFSLVHEARFRRELTDEQAIGLLDCLEASRLESRAPAELHRTAWRIADQLGLARTYDAEYVALA
jgi:predicted nucleic acid-binding protein